MILNFIYHYIMIFFSDLFIYIYILFKFFYFTETLLLQLLLLYTLMLLFNSNNIYYILLYFFIIIIYMGLIICYFNCELFTGFLWVTEFTVIFIALILFFFLNIDGLILKYNNNISNIYTNITYLLSFIFFVNIKFNLLNELINFEFLNFYILFNDFYESINNLYMNDFSILYLSYYKINSILFIIITLILFLASLVCVSLYKNNKNLIFYKFYYFFSKFNINKIFFNSTFIRKQNLSYQSNLKASLLIFNNK
uniref:Ymf62 n=1 Tax=Ichthyophthirius multifiliis TaxID=5932 RepID=G1FLE4_ICHMU|nr:Ymf62 [Ichthyophthirius multifiliis]AEL89286.1 Ymf62 [Ichthyophthirius multifiliis]